MNSDLLYNSKPLRKHYGSESKAAVAHADNTKDFRSLDGDIIPWECEFLLPTSFSGLSTIEGLKKAREGEPEVSYHAALVMFELFLTSNFQRSSKF